MNILHLSLVQRDYLNRDELSRVYINADKIIGFRPASIKRFRKLPNGNPEYGPVPEGKNFGDTLFDMIPCTEIAIGVGTTEDTGTWLVNETCDHILQQLPSDDTP